MGVSRAPFSAMQKSPALLQEDSHEQLRGAYSQAGHYFSDIEERNKKRDDSLALI
jgi:hypothetical protein